MASESISFSVSMPALAAVLDRLKGELLLQKAETRFLERAGAVVERRAKENVPPSDHRTSGIRRTLTHQVETDARQVRIGTDLAYARYVHGDFDTTETRTRPHWVPQAALEQLAEWAAIHGVVAGATYSTKTRRRMGAKSAQESQNMRAARAIAAGIAKRGTPLRPFLADALRDSHEDIDGFARDMAQDIAEAFGHE